MNHKIEISNIYSSIAKQRQALLKVKINLPDEDRDTLAQVLIALDSLANALYHLDLI